MRGGEAHLKGLLICGLALGVLVGVVVFWVLRRGGDVDQRTAGLYEECGMAMADLTHAALGRSDRILVLEHDGGGLPPEKQEWMQSQLVGFYAALHRGIQVEKQTVGSERFAGEQRNSTRGVDPLYLRARAFAPLAQQAPDVDVIVSFVGEPIVGNGGAAPWIGLPPIVCYSFSGNDVAALMEAGVLAAAIVPRRSMISVKEAKSKSWFETMHEIVTPENLSQWNLP